MSSVNLFEVAKKQTQKLKNPSHSNSKREDSLSLSSIKFYGHQQNIENFENHLGLSTLLNITTSIVHDERKKTKKYYH